MTFHEFSIGYAEVYRPDYSWMAEYIDSMFDRGMVTYDTWSDEIQSVHRLLHLSDHPERNYYWTIRDCLIYVLQDWDKFQASGKIFSKKLQKSLNFEI